MRSDEKKSEARVAMDASSAITPALHKTFHEMLEPIKRKYNLNQSQAFLAFGDACLRNAIVILGAVLGKPRGREWIAKAHKEIRLLLQNLE